ncbi:protein unc-93 homolog B1 [Callorhinchus milii]|uniref:Protein unc-93-like B1-like protein n=1 Tax=Callorhinchus milii TaxID=7868 RepID=V9KL48_CALMI|nr:protein unc-93 homolog B1 [Callorhinchus milii]XP_007894748.1 protein unc-93 homolog B1 [Callorhinchus milii]XP_042194715.1 protein unc-93 homolog B1 [Callorhinchus milii]|eukprot:gi/632957921/ref/XP_007894747.1/ PREDICTED: protein unc-93 homolog B1 [Callorhinchus milii]
MENDRDATETGNVIRNSSPAEILEDRSTEIDDFIGPNLEYDAEIEEERHFWRKRVAVVKNLVCVSVACMLTYGIYLGLLQMQLILHYDETYREVKYGNMGLQDIDQKMLMGINVTPVVALLYTPVLIRFLGTKWLLFLCVGVYALFVSTNYWERYYTLVPSAIAIGFSIVPLWTSIGNYITRMAQKYYEYSNYKAIDVQQQKKAPKGAYEKYIVIFHSVFYAIFSLSLVCAELPMICFLTDYLYPYDHTLYNVKHCGPQMKGCLEGLNKTVLIKLPRSTSLIIVESVMMGVAFLSMLLVLMLCGAAYRPTEEIDLRSIGWGNIFQLPFKHLRDFRLRLLIPFFVFSGLEMVFACTGFALSYGVCSLGLERLSSLIMVYGLSWSLWSLLSLSLPRRGILVAGGVLHLTLLLTLMVWAPAPRKPTTGNMVTLHIIAGLWGLGTAFNKSGLSALLGILYSDKGRQDFIFAVYHWCQSMAIFGYYLLSNLQMQVKLSILLICLVISLLSFGWMERKIKRQVPYRIPRIPKPRHKTKGYRYLEEENSDEEEDGAEEKEMEQDGGEDERETLRRRD